MDPKLTPKKRGNPNMIKGAASVNPAGRPRRGDALAEKVREATDGSDLIAILMELAKDRYTKPADRIHAVRALLDRGWGQPVAVSEVEATIAGPSELPPAFGDWTREEKAAYLATLVQS